MNASGNEGERSPKPRISQTHYENEAANGYEKSAGNRTRNESAFDDPKGRHCNDDAQDFHEEKNCKSFHVAIFPPIPREVHADLKASF